MQTIALRSFREEFMKHAAWRREDEQRVLERDRQEREKKREEALDDQHEAFFDFAVSVLATDTDIVAFTAKLDLYDAATVDALMENEEELATVREELQGLLSKAYVLPDGRRVFRTEDGTSVFDEHGAEVKDIDPMMIEEWRPKWERYENPFEREISLSERRGDLLEYQRFQDEIRDEQSERPMTKDRMDELEDLLAENAPEPVKRRMGIQPEASPDHTTTHGEEFDRTDDMAPTSPASRVMSPIFGG
ncbi:MAG TPA: hypothetical protein VGN93_17785 [Shinella sp.]|jgi:hypothetical protein|uniref:hypothetical protein n=1 Tax=Shinella sp. TaxID=1870904 RepID=UPI002E143374|nr:hypothetical protein [Shinella sp.]